MSLFLTCAENPANSDEEENSEDSAYITVRALSGDNYFGDTAVFTAAFQEAVNPGNIHWDFSDSAVSIRRNNNSSRTVDTNYIVWSGAPNSVDGETVDTLRVYAGSNVSDPFIVKIHNLAPVLDSILIGTGGMGGWLRAIAPDGNMRCVLPVKPGISYRVRFFSSDDDGNKVTYETDSSEVFGNEIDKDSSEFSWKSAAYEASDYDANIDSLTLSVSNSGQGVRNYTLVFINHIEQGTVWFPSYQQSSGELIKLSLFGDELLRIGEFSTIKDIVVDPGENKSTSVWIIERADSSRIYEINADGVITDTLSGFSKPRKLSLYVNDALLYIADDSSNSVDIYKKEEGKQPAKMLSSISRFNDMDVDQLSGDLWVATDTVLFRVRDGVVVDTIGDDSTEAAFGLAKQIAVTYKSGWIWVLDTRNSALKKIDIDGNELSVVSGFRGPEKISANWNDTSCWVADTEGDRVVRIGAGIGSAVTVSSSASGIMIAGGYSQPYDVDADPLSPLGPVCWVLNTQVGKVVAVDTSG
ncbi:MAG: hypothetical protein ACLFQK_08745, partial [Fibrobacterota bacterium]